MTFSSSQQLRDLFTAFMQSVIKTDLRGFSGSGLVLAYVVSDPAARIVLDAREPARPGKSFAYYIDDPDAPKPAVEIFLSAETLDQMYAGEINVTVAAAQGKIKSVGDHAAALRMLPVMFRTMNHYKAARAVFFSKVAH